MALIALKRSHIIAAAAMTALVAACATSSGQAAPPIAGPAPVPAPETGPITYASSGHAGMDAWRAAFSEKALAAGHDRDVVKSVLSGISPLELWLGSAFQPAKTGIEDQAEFAKPIWDYLRVPMSNSRISTGASRLAENPALFDSLEAAYGVDREAIVAIWGMETSFGAVKGNFDAPNVLANMAVEGRRKSLAERELLSLIKILEQGDAERDDLIAGWAGAMGHTQFMPSAYTHYATDGDGDGQVNLWESEEDALSSAANFLASLGWERSFRWGREVKLPEGFNYQESGYKNRKPLSEWHEQGVKKADGSPLGEGETTAYVIVPAGHNGPAFIAYKNFRVIMRWNNSEFYAIAVGVLADRIAGASGIKATLPDLPAYNRKDIIALQSKLNDLGFDVGKPDGIIGPATREGIRNYQISNNMIADGFPGLEVMAALNVELERDKASQS